MYESSYFKIKNYKFSKKLVALSINLVYTDIVIGEQLQLGG